jgi:hypothetical protein
MNRRIKIALLVWETVTDVSVELPSLVVIEDAVSRFIRHLRDYTRLRNFTLIAVKSSKSWIKGIPKDEGKNSRTLR